MRQAYAEAFGMELKQACGFPVIHLSGEGDERACELLESAISELSVRGYTRIILDTRDLRFLTPPCLETLEDLATRLEHEGGLLVAFDQCLPVERTLKLLGLERCIHVVPTLAQAADLLNWPGS
jgi:anti-anti-sigma factor